MKNLTYRSVDNLFEVNIDETLIEQMRGYCHVTNGFETGGILAGQYADDQRRADVEHISGPPHGSKHGRWTFFRAIGQLQGWIDELWSGRKGYYLGEWHFHPGGSPDPSGTDRKQLTNIARDSGFVCPEPILIILGGSPEAAWSLSVTVFTRDGRVVQLAKT